MYTLIQNEIPNDYPKKQKDGPQIVMPRAQLSSFFFIYKQSAIHKKRESCFFRFLKKQEGKPGMEVGLERRVF